MSDKKKHTEGLLRIGRFREGVIEIDSDQGSIAGVYTGADSSAEVEADVVADADRLIKCWNLHDRLVEELKKWIWLGVCQATDEDCERSNALLAEARGEGEG